MSDASKSLTDCLRLHTRSLHERAEQAFDLPSRLASRESYGALLCLLLGFYEPVEAAQAALPWAGAGFDFAPRRKAHLLRRDLAALAIAAPAAGTAPEPLPAPRSLAAAIGRQYVMEGATLGGQIVARQLHQQLGVGPDSGGSFYAGYGTRTGRFWRDFCKFADGFCGDDATRRDDALAAAAETFQAMEATLQMSESRR